MFGISYWILPLFAACVWLATLLAMLIVWITEGSPHYASMDATQHIAYISDIGAEGLKPLFIAGSTVCVVVFTATFLIERWLRHMGRLAHNTTKLEKVFSVLSVFFAVCGAAGLILLSNFDTLRHPHLHDDFLCLFIGGYIVSAICICAEYQRLGIHFREYKILRISFWVKLVFIIVELAMAIAFGVSSEKGHYNTAAVLEWIVALIYILFVASFVMDFVPAVRTKNHRFPGVDEIENAQHNGNGADMPGSHGYAQNGFSNDSYASEQQMAEQQAGRYYSPPNAPVSSSRNF